MKKLLLWMSMPLLVFVVTLAAVNTAVATQPNPGHKVTICHAHPADSIDGPWVSITVDVASVGYQHSGHQDQHDGDIIPPWSYTDDEGGEFSYPGKGDQSILENGCKASTPTETPPPTVTPPPTTPPPVVTVVPPPPGKPPVHPPTTTASTGLNTRALAGMLVLGAAGLGALWYARKLKPRSPWR